MPDVMRFDQIEVSRAARELRVRGEPVKLGGRAFDVLLALIDRRERVVPKSELFELVWPGLVVEENNLQVQVSTLRKVLGPLAISTIPGHGYRWLARDSAAASSAATSRMDAAPAVNGVATAGATAVAVAVAAADAKLIGRDVERAALQRLLSDGSGCLVTITGPAGIGKTVLAQAQLHECAAAAAAGLAEPVKVELAALTAAPLATGPHGDADPAVAMAVATALGATAPAAAPPLQRVLYNLSQRAATGTLPSVLLLDNAEHLLASVAALCRTLVQTAPALRILVTSQVRLGLPQEQMLRLDALGLPASADLADVQASGAAALFVARASAVDRRFALDAGNAAAVADICRRLDGIPLALELAAGRIALVGIEGLRDRLRERFGLLRRGAGRGAARHDTLLAALDWSHALLPPLQRTLLHRLSLFSGSFNASAAQALGADPQHDEHDEWDALDALAALVDKSLVAAHDLAAGAAGAAAEPRFHLLETVRDYARRHLDTGGETPRMARRHAEWFAAFAQAQGGGQITDAQTVQRHASLQADFDNLRAALAWFIAEDPARGLVMAGSLYPFWRAQGHLAEGRATCRALLERTREAAPSAPRIAVQVCLGALAMEQDDADDMQQMGEQVLAASLKVGDRRRQSHGYALLAHAALIRNRSAQARGYFESCLPILRELNDGRSVAEAMNNMAMCWLNEGRTDEAMAVLTEALPMVHGGDAWTWGAVLQTLGDVCFARGEVAAAQRHLDESLTLRRKTLHVLQVVMTLQSLALLALHRRHCEAARTCLAEAVAACRRHGFGQLDALSLAATGALALQVGHDGAAVRLLAYGELRLADTPIGGRPQVQKVLAKAIDGVRKRLGRGAWLAAAQEGRELDAAAAFSLASGVLT